jgi:hypothetical protein
MNGLFQLKRLTVEGWTRAAALDGKVRGDDFQELSRDADDVLLG